VGGADDVSIDNDGLVKQLRDQFDRFLLQRGSSMTERCFQTLVFACSVATLANDDHLGEASHLHDPDTPAAHGLELPDHCFPDGIVYGAFHDHRVVAVAYAHRTGLMEDN
jgi:hypothetical protein